MYYVISACKGDDNMNDFISRLRKGSLQVKTMESILFKTKKKLFLETRTCSDIATCFSLIRNRDSSVGIATRYRLDGPEIETRWGRVFPHRPDRPWGPLTSCTMGIGSFPGVKRPGRGADPPSSVEVMKRLGLYLYLPSGPHWPVVGRTFTFTFY